MSEVAPEGGQLSAPDSPVDGALSAPTPAKPAPDSSPSEPLQPAGEASPQRAPISRLHLQRLQAVAKEAGFWTGVPPALLIFPFSTFLLSIIASFLAARVGGAGVLLTQVAWFGAVGWWLLQPANRRRLGLFLERLTETEVVPTSEQRPGLAVQRDLTARPAHTLLLSVARPLPISLGRALPPILDPAFDAIGGVQCAPRHLALLGPIIREHAPRWQAAHAFEIEDGVARLCLQPGDARFDEADVTEIAGALQALAERLAAPPVEALSAMATDLAHPFDATRALAALDRDWAGPADRLAATLQQDPLGAAVVRMARTGEGLLDDTQPWAIRSAMARGALGVDGPARRRLLAEIPTLRPSNPEDARAILDLASAARQLDPAPALWAVIAAAERLI